mgnify:CR=1 FL=1
MNLDLLRYLWLAIAWFGTTLTLLLVRNGRYPSLLGIRMFLGLFWGMLTIIGILDVLHTLHILSSDNELLIRQLSIRPLFALCSWSFLIWLLWFKWRR